MGEGNHPARKDLWIVLILTALAFILRCYKIEDISFINDELSALIRLRFSSFSNLLQLGVAIDGHPAGVQAFLYYWTRIAGTSELAVRMPFVIIGALCIPLIYATGRLLFNRPAAIFSASLAMLSEMLITYSRLARPYAIGLFGVLLILWALSSVSTTTTKRQQFLYWGLYILGAVIAAYSHHIATLSALVAGGLGFMIISKKLRPRWLLSSAIALALYLPHTGITLAQLRIGGIGEWLAAPGPGALPSFLFAGFNRSWPLLILMLLLPLHSLFLRKKLKHLRPQRLYLFLCFVIPFLVTFGYSILINPVLQNSVLIFSLPAVYLLVGSFLPAGRETKPILISLLAYAAVAISFIPTQAYSGQTFADFRKAALAVREWDETYERDSILHLLNVNHPDYLGFYLQSEGQLTDFETTMITEPGDLAKLDSLLRANRRPYVMLIDLRPIRPEAAKMLGAYGTLIQSAASTRCSEAMLFSVTPARTNPLASDKPFLFMDGEFSQNIIEEPARGSKYGTVFTVKAEFVSKDPGDYVLAGTLEDRNGRLISWNGLDMDLFGPPGELNTAWLSFYFKGTIPDGVRVRAYIWNSSFSPGDSLQYRPLEIQSEEMPAW